MHVIMSFAQLDEKDSSLSLLYKINTRFRLGDQIIGAIEQVLLPVGCVDCDALFSEMPIVG